MQNQINRTRQNSLKHYTLCIFNIFVFLTLGRYTVFFCHSSYGGAPTFVMRKSRILTRSTPSALLLSPPLEIFGIIPSK